MIAVRLVSYMLLSSYGLRSGTGLISVYEVNMGQFADEALHVMRGNLRRTTDISVHTRL